MVVVGFLENIRSVFLYISCLDSRSDPNGGSEPVTGL